MNPVLARLLLSVAIQVLKRLRQHYENMSDEEKEELRKAVAEIDPNFGIDTRTGV